MKTLKINKLSNDIGLEWGEKTEELISKVKFNYIKRDRNIIEKVSKHLKLKLIYILKFNLKFLLE